MVQQEGGVFEAQISGCLHREEQGTMETVGAASAAANIVTKTSDKAPVARLRVEVGNHHFRKQLDLLG